MCVCVYLIVDALKYFWKDKQISGKIGYFWEREIYG